MKQIFTGGNGEYAELKRSGSRKCTKHHENETRGAGAGWMKRIFTEGNEGKKGTVIFGPKLQEKWVESFCDASCLFVVMTRLGGFLVAFVSFCKIQQFGGAF